MCFLTIVFGSSAVWLFGRSIIVLIQAYVIDIPQGNLSLVSSGTQLAGPSVAGPLHCCILWLRLLTPGGAAAVSSVLSLRSALVASTHPVTRDLCMTCVNMSDFSTRNILSEKMNLCNPAEFDQYFLTVVDATFLEHSVPFGRARRTLGGCVMRWVTVYSWADGSVWLSASQSTLPIDSSHLRPSGGWGWTDWLTTVRNCQVPNQDSW